MSYRIEVYKHLYDLFQEKLSFFMSLALKLPTHTWFHLKSHIDFVFQGFRRLFDNCTPVLIPIVIIERIIVTLPSSLLDKKAIQAELP